MDGWNGAEWNLTLEPDESVSSTLPWHPEADGMVNHKDAPEGFYDVYALPPKILRDAGEWHGPLSKFLVVQVVKD
jgi:hypothetical protein